MLELFGKENNYQDFKWEVIAKIPEGPFEIEFYKVDDNWTFNHITESV